MRNFSPIFTLSCAVLLFFHQGACLRCRAGNQQVDAQFQKVLRTCRNRNAGLNTDNGQDSTSSEDSSSESDSNSDEHVYDKNFFYKKGERPTYNQSTNNNQISRNSDSNGYSFDQQINGNIGDMKNVKQMQKNGDRDSWNSRDARNRKNDSNNGDMRFGNNTSREQACIVQCFFNELNAVDQKGFPERDLVLPLMSQNIQDPELKDFVEESIVECFRYLETSKREKCEFSQNLLTCLAEKGQQKCEDWEN